MNDPNFKYLLNNVGAKGRIKSRCVFTPFGITVIEEPIDEKTLEIQQLNADLSEKVKKLESANDEIKSLTVISNEKDTENQLLKMQNGFQEIVIRKLEDKVEELNRQTRNRERDGNNHSTDLDDTMCLVCRVEDPRCGTCHKRFHLACLSQWVREAQPTCPACRSRITLPRD